MDEAVQPGTPAGLPGDLPLGVPVRAIEECLRMLKSRDRLRAEVASRLSSRGFDEVAVAGAIDYVWGKLRIDEQQVVNDLVDHMHGLGVRAIRERLEARGASPEDIDLAVRGLDDRAELAQVVRERRTKGDDDPKIWRFLATKGFDEDDVRSVLGLD